MQMVELMRIVKINADCEINAYGEIKQVAENGTEQSG